LKDVKEFDEHWPSLSVVQITAAMKSLLLVLVLALSAASSSAFVKGVPRVSRQETCVYAEKKASKKAAKKTTTKAEPKPKKPPAPTVRKPEFLASIAEKTGMSKKDSDAALTAVLETIQEVSLRVSLCVKARFATITIWACKDNAPPTKCPLQLTKLSVSPPKQEISAGNRINFLGFGTFKLSERAARTGRNPQTGEAIEIKASKSLGFTASKTLKEKMNQ
jgi:DNA-binding protein HU-beta